MPNCRKILSVVIFKILIFGIASAQIQEPPTLISKNLNSDGKVESETKMNNLSVTVKVKNDQVKSSKAVNTDAPLIPAEQEMIFRYEYQNNARIFQQQGWYMDKQGGVYKYSYERIFDSHKLSEYKFHLKFKVRPTLIAQIPVDVLKRKLQLVERLKNGEYEEKSVANDAGTGKVSAFLENAKTGEYQQINLMTHGDYEGKNASIEAVELLEWLFVVVPEYTF